MGFDKAGFQTQQQYLMFYTKLNLEVKKSNAKDHLDPLPPVVIADTERLF